MPKYRDFHYSQHEDQRWTSSEITEEGVCFALSIFWVIKSSQGANFIEWLGPDHAASSTHGKADADWGEDLLGPVRRVMQQQDKLLNLPQVDSALNMKWATRRISKLEDGTGSSVLVPSGRLRVNQQATGRQIAAEVTSEDGFKLVGWTIKGSGSHLTAALVNGSEVWFFDPNFGQYIFPELESFQTWFVKDLFQDEYQIQDTVDEAEIQHFT